MKLVFLSNFFSHHQSVTAEEWYKTTDKAFYFVETEEFSQERKHMGWEMLNPPFVVKNSSKNAITVDSIIYSADAVILGSAPISIVKKRLNENKEVFKCSERVFKQGYSFWKWIPRIIRYWYNYGRYKSLYLLCASAYTSADYAMHGTFLNKSYKWGYFPKTNYYEIPKLFARKKNNRILWCGRFLKWKHPDIALEVARRLKSNGYEFEMLLIGSGEMKEYLADRIDELNLSEHVQLLGAMTPDKVRSYMEVSGIYMFTSDFHEGWGAVLNEAMNSGCAVVASHAIGSVPYLINHRQNGLIYENGCLEDLYLKVRYLLDNHKMQRLFGESAYNTIINLWNGELAAQRFMCFEAQIRKHGKCDLYESGPCSRAETLKNNWFKADAAELLKEDE